MDRLLASCPRSADLVALLRGTQWHGAHIASDEMRALRRYYGRPEARGSGAVPNFEDAKGGRATQHEAVRDGLRVLAYLAPHLLEGEDPVKIVIRGLSALGFEVPGEDLDWAEEE